MEGISNKVSREFRTSWRILRYEKIGDSEEEGI